MSQANASAIKRRANINPSPPITGASTQNNAQISPKSTSSIAPGLTLPQVIELIDNRLIKLEKFMNDTGKPVSQEEPAALNNVFSEIIDEYNHRFEVLADELSTMKGVILKLQTYTMDVNKTLMDERIHVLSDLSVSPRSENISIEQIADTQPETESNTSVDIRNLAKTELEASLDA